VGLAAELVSWDDPNADWANRDLVVLRSTWDSVNRPDEYLAWIRYVDGVSSLLNPRAVVEWNFDKTYLEDLGADGVSVIPTHWVRPGATWVPPAGEFVVKPSISAGARDTARYGPEHLDAARDHVTRLGAENRTVMVQAYLPAVAESGELSVIFIDGQISHAIRKGPMLELGVGVEERPWERMVFVGTATPTALQVEAAETTMSAVRRRFPDRLLYGRVDLIDSPAGRPLVLEAEVIDPNLSLALHPPAAAVLAQAIAKRVRDRSRSF
jgi:glutathione synthase/RimK-type ligase-like ATP-grasp enzyme